MCIDFKNINAACPKYYYPLPEIDSKIESVMGFPLKCFLNAYKGYHQVQMAEEDEEKTAFYTDQAASKEAVSAVLLVVRKEKQYPIHYVSRTLHDAERNYAPLEKMALALRHVSRRLRRYFEAHPITVITDQPIKQILSKADTSDGTSSVKGSGTGLVLISLTKTEYTYDLSLNFESTNNQA
ncbi:reverse transcriptase domain-containing protein [Tanacetum coccineum]|uniref:Reverse transcriptase domain-containing protein n=1 Tax=Tanacetum coccineum TaxID=301880 RepID=A0ABQ5D886_9ASTR